MFFGFDPENPGISYYPDSLIIKDSDSVREMYKLKLNYNNVYRMRIKSLILYIYPEFTNIFNLNNVF